MLAIVGGSGRLPDILSEAEPDAPRYAPEGVAFGCGANPARSFRVERLGALVDEMRAAGVGRIVFAGAMRRPELDTGWLDGFTHDALAALGGRFDERDDALLRGVVGVFERAGFDVVAAHEVVPGLLPPAGVMTGAAPGPEARSDAERGFAIIDALAPLDVGQGCVVEAGQVLAIETLGGTDWMLETLAGRVPGRTAAGSGVLCKGPKAGQDRRIDIPTIGPATVAAARAAGLGGIAIAAGGVNLLDRDETVAAADAAGMFLWVREP